MQARNRRQPTLDEIAEVVAEMIRTQKTWTLSILKVRQFKGTIIDAAKLGHYISN